MTDTELLASAFARILRAEDHQYVEVAEEGEDVTLDGTWDLSADEMAAIRRVWVRPPAPEPSVSIPPGATVYLVRAPDADNMRWFLDENEAAAYQRKVGGGILMSNQHSPMA